MFANTASLEARRKNIRKGTDLFDYLNDKTFVVAKETGLDVFFFSEELQHGLGFCNRFANAVDDIFKKGYKNIITIGNDSPDLRTRHILTAERNLQKGISTLGPSKDGGAYLIAIPKAQFFKEKFSKLPWQSAKLLIAFENYLQINNVEVNRLEFLNDIDATSDLKQFLTRYKYTARVFVDLIVSLQDKIKKVVVFFLTLFKAQFFSIPTNKGSPIHV